MTRTVGEQFYHVAMGPLAMAANCLRRGDVRQGLTELSGDSLVGSVQRAIDAIAETVGLPTHEVERLLPTEEMDDLLEGVATTQSTSAAQWDLHMAHAGGLLEAIAKLTSDGRAPEAGMCLMRIATKMKLEKGLASPLRELAGHIERWQELLERVRRELDEGKELKEARQRRRVVRVGIAGLTGVAVLAVAALVTTVWKARRQIDDVLALPSPCEVELLLAADLSMASAEQKSTLVAKHAACSGTRELARIAEEKIQEDKARQLREAEAKRTREATCIELGVRLSKPSTEALSPKLKEILAKDMTFMTALARGKIDNADVSRDVSNLTCLDGQAGDAIAGAFAAALAQAGESWLPEHTPSPSALTLVKRGKASVSRIARANLIPPIEKVALDALLTGKSEPVRAARKKCDVLTMLDVTPHLYCQAVLRQPVN